jgi:hypothetical protein
MDHATPISIKTHSRDPVPLVIGGIGIEPDGVQSFDEAAAKEGGYGLGGGGGAGGYGERITMWPHHICFLFVPYLSPLLRYGYYRSLDDVTNGEINAFSFARNCSASSLLKEIDAIADAFIIRVRSGLSAIYTAM